MEQATGLSAGPAFPNSEGLGVEGRNYIIKQYKLT
jgi:hypothetical protein